MANASAEFASIRAYNDHNYQVDLHSSQVNISIVKKEKSEPKFHHIGSDSFAYMGG